MEEVGAVAGVEENDAGYVLSTAIIATGGSGFALARSDVETTGFGD